MYNDTEKYNTTEINAHMYSLWHKQWAVHRAIARHYTKLCYVTNSVSLLFNAKLY